MQLCIKLLNHLAKFVKLFTELSLNFRKKFKNLWKFQEECRNKQEKRCLAARKTNKKKTSKICRVRVYNTKSVHASATYQQRSILSKNNKKHTSKKQNNSQNQQQHTPNAVSREQKLKMAASVLNKLTRYKLQRVNRRTQRTNGKTGKIERRQTKWQQGKRNSKFLKNQHQNSNKIGSKLSRRAYDFLYELHPEDCLTNYLTSNSCKNSYQTNKQLTHKRTADSENSISNIGTGMAPRPCQYYWVYFFHNQLPQRPPMTTASEGMPQGHRALSLTTIPPAPPTSRTSLRPVNETRINKAVQRENESPDGASPSKVEGTAHAKKEELKDVYIRSTTKGKSGKFIESYEKTKNRKAIEKYFENLPQPKPELLDRFSTGPVGQTVAAKPISGIAKNPQLLRSTLYENTGEVRLNTLSAERAERRPKSKKSSNSRAKSKSIRSIISKTRSAKKARVLGTRNESSSKSQLDTSKSANLEIVGRKVQRAKQETAIEAEERNSSETKRTIDELRGKRVRYNLKEFEGPKRTESALRLKNARVLPSNARSSDSAISTKDRRNPEIVPNTRARGGADPTHPTNEQSQPTSLRSETATRLPGRRVTLPRDSLLARHLNTPATETATPQPTCCAAGCRIDECPTYSNPETRDQCQQMQPSIIRSERGDSQNLLELRQTILANNDRATELVRMQQTSFTDGTTASAQPRHASAIQAALTEARRTELNDYDRSLASINRSLMVRLNDPPPMRLSQMPQETPSTPRNSNRTLPREAPSSERIEADTQPTAILSNHVVADLQRPPNRQSGTLSMQARNLLGMEALSNAFDKVQPTVNIKELPTAATVYNTQYFKPLGDESKKSKRLRKHFQLKTPYFPTARYPPVYNVYTTASMLKFKHKNVVIYDEKTLNMVGEPNKPLSPIGAKRTSKRPKADKEQNTMSCICQTAENQQQQQQQLQQPCACQDQPSEVSCTCSSPLDKCPCQLANLHLTPRQRRFPPNNRTILRRCITTGGGAGFECQHIRQYFKQIKRAIRRGRIVKCGNPYCGQCFQHPKEAWSYTINRQFYDKHRCYEEPTANEECEEEDECIVQELFDSDNERMADDMYVQPPCDYSKCKRQYDTLEERTKRMWGHNRKLEVDSEELNSLLKRAYKLRMEQYHGEPCISDSDRLRKLERADRRLHRKFNKYQMNVKTTEHFLCPPEELEAEEEASTEAYTAEEEAEPEVVPISRCPPPAPKVKPCCSDSDTTKYVRLVSGDVDDILKRHRCDLNECKQQQQQRSDIKNWYSPLATTNLCPKISISQIPRSFVIQK